MVATRTFYQRLIDGSSCESKKILHDKKLFRKGDISSRPIPLTMTIGSEPIGTARRSMFGFTAAHPLAPELERRRFHVLPHHGNHLRFGESELKFNRLEGGAVFPGHFNDPVQILAGEGCHRCTEQKSRR